MQTVAQGEVGGDSGGDVDYRTLRLVLRDALGTAPLAEALGHVAGGGGGSSSTGGSGVGTCSSLAKRLIAAAAGGAQ